jgi:hypothetical protein
MLQNFLDIAAAWNASTGRRPSAQAAPRKSPARVN